MTIEQVADRLLCSPSKISRIETTRVAASQRDVRDLLAVYQVDKANSDRLMQIAREARQRIWVHEFHDVPTYPFADLEQAASKLQMFAPQLVPGLFQSEDYARAVFTAVLPKHSATEVERRVQLRMKRQERLQAEEPPSMWAVIDEAALRRRIGGGSVMRGQLDHLVEVAALPTVTLQVLPFAGGAHAGLDGAFTIIKFPDPADSDVVYLENSSKDIYMEEDEVIRLYTRHFDFLRADALSPGESRDFFVTVAKEIG